MYKEAAMDNVTSWQIALSSVAGTAFGQTLAFLPRIFGAVLVFVLGIVLGNWMKTLVVKGLQFLKLESFAKESKVKQFLTKAEVSQKVEEIVGSIVKWVIVLVFFIAATNILGLTTVATLLGGILGYIPNVISAVIVLAIGVLLAGVVESVVKGALASVDLKTSRLMGKVASYTVVTIAILAAFSELKIAESFINILFIGFVAMLALGFGLAIGLGAKDTVSTILSEWRSDLTRELKKK
jgi:hypothetical protein